MTRFKAPPAEDLIADLVEYHADWGDSDFVSREVWENRLQSFGYAQLMIDWIAALGPQKEERL